MKHKTQTNTDKITYSAPAKVILSGEHAVVYGKPALVSAIDLRLKFSLWQKQVSPDNHLSNDRDLDGNIEDIANLIRNFLEKKKELINRNNRYQYGIDSSIPSGRGLGSSAALSVAAAAAFLEFFSGKGFDSETINSLAYKVEKKFHQNPSGVDNTVSSFGGLIYYRKELEFLKNIGRLNFKIPPKIEQRLYLIDSGKPQESTAKMVSYIGSLCNKKPKLVAGVLNEIEKTTKRMTTAIVKEDGKLFANLIKNNELLLEKLGIISLKTKRLLRDLRQFGEGKITGAGGKKAGSGFLLFYAEKIKEMKEFCLKKELIFFKFKQAAGGLMRE